MAFLKKKIAGVGVSSHSRSSSTSSTRLQPSVSATPSKSSVKPPALPPKIPPKGNPSVENPNSESVELSSSTPDTSFDSRQSRDDDNSFSFQEGVSLQYTPLGSQQSSNDSPLSVIKLSDDVQNITTQHKISGSNECTESRKSSNGSTSSLALDKLLFSWDVTDPEEWTMKRVVSWFHFNNFNETWVSFFSKYQIYGNKFLKLLAYDNFVRYEKFLPQTKSSCYSRFQYLLKLTLEKNVISGHIQHQSNKSSGLRCSSDSVKLKSRQSYQSVDTSHSRSTSESMLSHKKTNLDITDDKPPPPNTQQKTKNASALYRRSFISLRGSSSGGNNDSASNIKIKIPVPPPITTESSSQPYPVNSRSSASPLSPNSSHTYTGIFRRQHKTSSSESSIFNSLFGGNNNSVEETALQGKSSSGRSLSSENLSKRKSSYEPSSSPLKQSPVTEDKSKIWDKLKRKSAGDGLSPCSSKPLSEVKVAKDAKLEPIKDTDKSFDWKKFMLDKKYFPLNKTSETDRFILVTKDNRSFIPLNVGMVNNLTELKECMALTLGISHKNFTIHLTDYGCEIGCAIPDEILETLRLSLFLNVPTKFYVRDQTRIQLRPRADTVPTENTNNLTSTRSKGSIKSAASSIISSNDDVSTFNSSSDITSIDDQGNNSGRRIYPQTPIYYYSNGSTTTTNGNEVDYWNFKDAIQEEHQPVKLPKMRTSSNTRLRAVSEVIPVASSSFEDRGSFKVIRKDDNNEIDFNKRRESPYAKSELAPKREAPRPPISSQAFLNSTASLTSNSSLKQAQSSPPKLQRKRTGIHARRKSRPPPPVSNTSFSSVETLPGTFSNSKRPSNGSSESVVHSYTPGSSQVLVPQPYKGARDATKMKKSGDGNSDGVLNPVSTYINHQRLNRSNSIVSTTGSMFQSPPRLMKRASSRRVVSSASAADVFIENEVSFANAPELSESEGGDTSSDSSGDIIWSTNKQKEMKEQGNDVPGFSFTSEDNNSDNETVIGSREAGEELLSEDQEKGNLDKKMTLRPSPEVVYQNLEKFFPGTDLDKPIVEGSTPPPSPKSLDPKMSGLQLEPKCESNTTSPITSRTGTPAAMVASGGDTSQEILKPTSKSLKPPRRTKTIRIIAREASEARKDSKSKKLKRKNTKMWGTRVVEVTDKGMVSIDKSKNSRGEYKEFAWIKGEMIGKGSFGAVYLGLNVTTGEMMAVKQVEVPKFGSQDEATISVVEALRSEVSTLKNLDHLNIVQYLGFENKNSIYSLFLEYVAGGSVGSLIRLYGRFDESLIRFLTVQVLRGLSYLHSRGILHRDMKADNLLLDLDGVCKISDFGISRKSNDIYCNSDMTMRGTVFWMAPEMVDTKQGYSAKVDIWSLGCVVLEMFAGKRPWSNLEVVAAMFKIGKSKTAPPIPEDTLPLISKEGREFLDACFEIDPERRPTADTLLRHRFCEVKKSFDFKKTQVADFIKSNDRLNYSKLRVGPQDI